MAAGEERGSGEAALPDILGPDLDILFVGFNPSPRSALLRHHYAGRGNQFWRLLAAAGLTPRLLRPEEDASLPGMKLGLTNLVARPTRSSADLSRVELRAGLPRLEAVVAACRPRILAFAGKGVYEAAVPAGAPWGEQRDPLFAGTLDYVLPSPSGLARMDFAGKLRWYAGLRDCRDRLSRPR